MRWLCKGHYKVRSTAAPVPCTRCCGYTKAVQS